MKENTSPINPLGNKKQVPVSETIFYAVYFVGQNLIYFLVTNFLMFFYTDYAMILPSTVAIIFAIAKIWDAINDPIFGMLIDRKTSKKAKFTPWIKASSLLLPLSTVLVFTIPAALPTWAKVVLAFLTYALWDILYTVSDVPIFAVSTAMTDNINERTNLVSYGRMGGIAGALVITLIAPLLIKSNGMLVTVIIMCSAAAVTMIPIGFIAKERVTYDTEKHEEDSTEKEAGFKEMFTYLKGNKYLMYFFGSFIIHNLFKVTLNNYISEHLLGGIEKIAIVGIFSLPFLLIIYIVLPGLTRRFDRMTIYKISIIGSIFMGVVQFFVGYKNFNLYVVISVIKGIIEGFAGVLMFTFSGDAVEYGHYKTGIRKEGITFSIQTFSAKFTSALASVMTSIVLVLIGYRGGQVVTASMGSWMWAASCFLPSLGALLSMYFLNKYDITVKDVQVMSSINAGHVSREEGDKLLSRKY